MQIQDSVAVVTGGQRGIGKALVDQLLAAGARTVYATARRPEPSADPRIVPVPLEVTDPDSVARLAATARDARIVVNNAGVSGTGPLLDATDDELRKVLDANLFGPLRIARAFAPILAANGGGALVDVHSVLSWLAGSGAYGISKAALWSATNSLRRELAPAGTLVVGVHMGYVDTDMTRGIDAPKVTPRQVAAAVVAAVEHGDTEVLVDDLTRHVKSALSGPVEQLALA
ncbi:SDR family oxidoreductase [Nocardia sp. alder85J]|uniref:SDR family oxidoreductase n=1 Tax=Nocardia sp. alder85J TaxID=2862949 RepID=UPI001CD807CB|nr:SDR family oxidoreductase [Nocardia sp. alder85J]MCX4099191.1 SDR family oxidoreductase [Nocardia sp. alder85J]